jgi:UDPglucose 6-dehydrogenase/GDP-mannose 6-dehydrogenase
MNITFFGTGYVGLVSSVCLAGSGKYVYCVDIDQDKIDQIKDNKPPFHEPGLAELLKTKKQYLHPTMDAREAILNSEVVFLAVGTPFNGSSINLDYIKTAASEIGTLLAEKNKDQFTVVVVKSTVTPGTTENVVKKIVLEKSGKTDDQVGFCMNPEFLREGNAVEDFQQPDRIVLGVSSEKVAEVMKRVYSNFPETDILITNPTTAEMIKYTANSYLALTISYANEIARICETLENVDSEEVFRGVILDKRISPIENGKRITPKLSTYLRAGTGFGGSCFPKDVKALESFAHEKTTDGHILGALLKVNDSQILHTFERGFKNHQGEVKKIAILGTAFKPETDDIRESPGIKLARLALENDIEVNVQDYIALENTEIEFGEKVNYFQDPIEAVQDADLIYITTIWPQYQQISDQVWQENIKEDTIMIDTRSLYKSRENKPWRIRTGYNQVIDKVPDQHFQTEII